jgi:hypothetical protein
MAYVKISDPAIMDLAGIQQIINVVNQHSDYLNVLINKLGINNVPNWNDEDWAAINDAANTTIAFGRERLTNADNEDTVNGKKFYSKVVSSYGPNASFSTPPRVVATIDNTGKAANAQLDLIVTVDDVTSEGFVLRIMRAGTQAKQNLDTSVRINWIAIGPR